MGLAKWRPLVESAAVASLLCLNRAPWGWRRYATVLTMLVLLTMVGLSAGPKLVSGITVQQEGSTTITIISWVNTWIWITVKLP